MSLRCVCGNRLESRPYRVVVSPCKCVQPGPGRSTLHHEDLLYDDQFVSEKQVRERRRLGLPAITDLEKSFYRENGRKDYGVSR